jgi:hypothetical protein
MPGGSAISNRVTEVRAGRLRTCGCVEELSAGAPSAGIRSHRHSAYVVLEIEVVSIRTLAAGREVMTAVASMPSVRHPHVHQGDVGSASLVAIASRISRFADHRESGRSR